MTHTW